MGFWSTTSMFGGTVGPVSGYAAWPSLIGAEMMVNGDCSSGTGWTLAAGTVIAAGKMTMTAAVSDTYNSGVLSLIGGATYRCAFTIDSLSVGSVRVIISSQPGTVRSAPGTYSEDIVNPLEDVNEWALSPNSATMQLDNFSVKSVGLLGVEADWVFTGGGAFWDAGRIVLEAGVEGDNAQLTGAALTAFDAAVSTNTACSVTVTFIDGDAGDVMVSLRGGTAVAFSHPTGIGTVEVAHTVTSGAGSGPKFAQGPTPGANYIPRIQITLA